MHGQTPQLFMCIIGLCLNVRLPLTPSSLSDDIARIVFVHCASRVGGQLVHAFLSHCPFYYTLSKVRAQKLHEMFSLKTLKRVSHINN